MPNSIPDDIRSYLAHDDYNLAVRRTLDMALDTDNSTVIRKAIAWSKTYRAAEAQSLTATMPASFLSEANEIPECNKCAE